MITLKPQKVYLVWCKRHINSCIRKHRYNNWIKFLNDCDGILTSAAESMKTLPQFVELEKHLNKKKQTTNSRLNQLQLIILQFE